MGGFDILFWKGGAKAGEWVRAVPAASQKQAVALVAEIEKAGRPALWMAPGRLDAVGMPEGAPFWWDFVALAPKRPAPMKPAALAARERAMRA